MAQQYAPDVVADAVYYEPTQHGAEQRAAETVRHIRERLANPEGK